MKNPTFLSMVLIAVLMVVAVSCTPLQQAQGDYEERPSTSRRVYVTDPYYGGGTTYLVRDPYTGMYYEVRPYGYSPYGSYYGGYDRYNDPYYNSRYYRNAPSRGTTERKAPAANQQKSRGTVLGKN